LFEQSSGRAVDILGAQQIWARMVSFRFLGADSLGSATQRAQIVA
jgi:hypothetical protein